MSIQEQEELRISQNLDDHPSDMETVTLIIPGMILLGIYLVVNGHISPGGGFQGGAALAAVVVSHFIMKHDSKFSITDLELIEKAAFVIIVLCGLLFIFTGFFLNHMRLYVPYIVLMNLLLGTKVFCGLSIIFIEFTKTFGSDKNERAH